MCAWALGKGVAFLYCSRLAVRCLCLCECTLLGVVKNVVVWSGRPGQGCLFCSARMVAFSRFLGCCGGVSSCGCRGLSKEVGCMAKPAIAEECFSIERCRKRRRGLVIWSCPSPCSLGRGWERVGFPMPLGMSLGLGKKLYWRRSNEAVPVCPSPALLTRSHEGLLRLPG